MNRLATSSIIIFALALSLFTPKVSAEDFKIGAILCLSGECAEWGNNSLNGIKLAIKELNASSGILNQKISLILEDSQESLGGAKAISAYQKIIQDPDLQFLIGPTWSIGGAPLAPIVAKNKNIIITSPSLGIADFNEAGDQIFNLWPHDSTSTEKLATEAIGRGWNKTVIINANDPWGIVQAEVFKKKFLALGGKVLNDITPALNATSFKAESLTVKRLQPDFVFHADLYKISQVAKDLRRAGYQRDQITILIDETRIKEAQGALEDILYARYPTPNNDFVIKYQEEYGANPGITADTAYDTVKLYAEAINQVGKIDLPAIQAQILKTKMLGASGQIVFDSQGGVIKQPLIYQVKNGQEVLVK